ncbi:MAG: hypothetical protein QM804_12760 [Propionicimonas sp.]
MSTTRWDRLFHAYGTAGDTPGHLAALRGTDPAAVKAALTHLDGAILHQDTVWTATPPVVAEVIDLITAPQGHPELAALVRWLGWAMDAVRDLEVGPEPIPVPDEAELEAFLTATAEENEAAWGMPVLDLLMRQAVVDVRALAPRIAAAVVPLLDHADGEVRREALSALGSAAGLVPAAERHPLQQHLAALVSASDHRDEKAARLLALGAAGGNTSEWLTDPDPAVRACAALGDAGPAATAVLLDVLRDPAGCDAWFERRPPQLHTHVRFALLSNLLSREVALAELVPAATAMIALAGGFDLDRVVGPILQRTFPEVRFTPGVRPAPAENWTEAQCAIVAALVANDRIWDPTDGNANLARMRVGLPEGRDAVAALLAQHRRR